MLEGKHVVKLKSYGIQEGKEGKAPSLVLLFRDELGEEITHYMSLSQAALPYTLKAMLGPLGLIAEPDQVGPALERIAMEGPESAMLNTEKDIEIVVEPDTYNGKTRMKVKWVNEVGSSQAFGKIASERAKGLFAGLNIAGAAAEVKQNLPKKKDDILPF